MVQTFCDAIPHLVVNVELYREAFTFMNRLLTIILDRTVID